MALDYVFRDSVASTSVSLRNRAGQPFPGTSPATFTVTDFNGAPILSGTGVQDTMNPETWTASFSIPAAAPLPMNGEKYAIAWVIRNDSETASAVEYFSVRVEGDPISFENGRIALKGGSITDTLMTDAPVTNVHLRLLDESDTAYVDVDVPSTPTRLVNGLCFYDYTTANIPVLDQRLSLMPHLAEWTYTDPFGSPALEVHPIYVISSKMFLFIDAVKKVVDRARNNDINPNLRYTDIDLAHYVLEGLQRVNVNAPTFTNFTPDTVPFVFHPLVKDCAAVRALQAQYLAEGVSAFDFQGQSVQLNVDRTQYIQQMIDMLNTDLDERIRKAKKIAVRASGAGVLGISVSPSTNYAAMLNPRDRMILLRQRYLNR